MKTIVFLNLVFSIVATFCLSGCYSIYYAPNAQNVPMFIEKKEARISVAYCVTDDGTGYNSAQGVEIQSAYAVGNHFAIIANGFKAESSESDELYSSGIRNGSTSLIEMGAGYFKPLKKKKLILEIYGGLGSGRFKNRFIAETDTTKTVYSSVNFDRYFIQPSIGYSKPHFGVAFSLRLALLSYDKRPELGLSTSYFLAEPCFTIRAGWRSFKFQTQIQLSNNLTDRGFPQHHLNVNTGLCLILPVKRSTE